MIPQGKPRWCSCCASTKEPLQPERLQNGEGLPRTPVRESRAELGRARSAEGDVEPCLFRVEDSPRERLHRAGCMDRG